MNVHKIDNRQTVLDVLILNFEKKFEKQKKIFKKMHIKYKIDIFDIFFA